MVWLKLRMRVMALDRVGSRYTTFAGLQIGSPGVGSCKAAVSDLIRRGKGAKPDVVHFAKKLNLATFTLS